MADSADPSAKSGLEKVTPFMAQFFAAKDAHPDALVFFRMGDFYELFFEDAEKAAAALGITLTKRGQHQGDAIPMCGVPWHQADGYLARLIRQGFKVAVVEQMEDPAEAKKRGSKSIVRREVVRVVTPGTLTDDALLDARWTARLAAIAFGSEGAALAWADVSTGAFEVGPIGRLEEALAAVAPAEVLVAEPDAGRVAGPVGEAGAALTFRPAAKADAKFGARRARELFEVATLDGFGAFGEAELSAIGLLLDYVELTQAGAAPRLKPPRRSAPNATMAIDPATRAALEIERSVRGGRDGSLLAAIDRTVTAAGGRLLAERLGRPLTDVAAIARRHDSVAFFHERRDLRSAVRAALRASADIARAQTRLALGRGGPRDLASLRDGLRAGEAAAGLLPMDAPAEIDAAAAALTLPKLPELAAFAAHLGRVLALELPALARDGGFIAEGADAALDAARALRDDSRRVIAALQQDLSDRTGLPLKVRHNSVLGYHVEATPKQAEILVAPPHSALFIHRQTTANAVRFTTTELAELDRRIERAGADALARELALFQGLAQQVAALEGPLRAAADALALLDVATALADWADEVDAVRPEIDESGALIAEGARHPVVEQALRKEGKPFTANDVRLDAEGQAGARLLLVTGPNMAGKSTYLRQIALLAVLAQAGAFVPARRLRLGIVDRVFSRVGASDDLSRGRSTFMMEMVETAAILNQSGPRALVVLDEVGRGTATFDGLAIAWAVAEHLHDANRCRAVFATHYHEITVLPERLTAAANASLRAKEWKGDLVFLHEVASGPADRSYGIQVARLAGLPRAAVERAKTVLSKLESGKGGRMSGGLDALPLFADAPPPPEPSAVEARLAALDPDSMSPREALEALYALKKVLG